MEVFQRPIEFTAESRLGHLAESNETCKLVREPFIAIKFVNT
jgi:hypothetical protein